MFFKHKKNKFRVLLTIFQSCAVLLALSLGLSRSIFAQSGQCMISSGSWANSPLVQSQSNNFRITFDAIPSLARMDSVAGLSSGSAGDYTDLAAAVRFNNSGTIDARNGSGFSATNSIPYSPRSTYHFTLDVYPEAHVYDVYVLVGSELHTLAENLAFRSEQSNVSSLAYMGSFSSQGVLAICNITITSSSGSSGGGSTGGSSGGSSGGSTLSASSTSLNFGAIGVSHTGSQTVTLTNSGNSNVTISQVSVSGAGFTVSGSAAGLILSPRQFATVNATFSPSSTGTATGSVKISSNAANSPSTIALSGSGIAASGHSVTISWNPSSGAAGYNVYVSSRSGGPYTQANYTGTVTSLNFLDSAVQSNQTYYYVVTALNWNHQESTYSPEIQATIP